MQLGEQEPECQPDSRLDDNADQRRTGQHGATCEHSDNGGGGIGRPHLAHECSGKCCARSLRQWSDPHLTAGGGIVCEYTGGAGNAGVTIFALQSATVFAGQVAHAGTAPGMQAISGVGDRGFALTAGGRSIVNACSNASRTLVAAQAPGALAPVEALARGALSDN